MNINIMQSDYRVCPEAAQLAHHFLLPTNVVALEKSINLEELVLKFPAVNSST